MGPAATALTWSVRFHRKARRQVGWVGVILTDKACDYSEMQQTSTQSNMCLQHLLECNRGIEQVILRLTLRRWKEGQELLEHLGTLAPAGEVGPRRLVIILDVVFMLMRRRAFRSISGEASVSWTTSLQGRASCGEQVAHASEEVALVRRRRDRSQCSLEVEEGFH